MIVVERWWLGVAVAALAAVGAACSSGSSAGSTSTTTSGTGGSTSSTTGTGGSTSSTTGGTGGSSTTTSGTGGGSTTTSGTGGDSGYTCNTCLDPSPGAGAKGKECKTEGDACFNDQSCVDIFVCAYTGTMDGMGNPVGPCDNSAAGACCTFQCYALINAKVGDAAGQAAINLYEALDQCSTCGVCEAVCGDGAAAYCATYAMGAGVCK